MRKIVIAWLGFTPSLGAVIWWGATDDVRWYAMAQFYPMLAIPLLLLCFPGRRFRAADWGVIAGCYAAAKLTELLDHEIHDALGFSGHSLKHLLAAGAPFWVPRLASRTPARIKGDAEMCRSPHLP